MPRPDLDTVITYGECLVLEDINKSYLANGTVYCKAESPAVQRLCSAGLINAMSPLSYHPTLKYLAGDFCVLMPVPAYLIQGDLK